MPVPAATPASAFFAPGSPWAKPYPPITIATRLATFAIVPVKRDWMALKPVSNGEPCAIAAPVITISRVRRTAGGRANFEQATSGIWRMKRTRNERGICTSAAPQIGCLWRKINLTRSRCPMNVRRIAIPGRNGRAKFRVIAFWQCRSKGRIYMTCYFAEHSSTNRQMRRPSSLNWRWFLSSDVV